MLEQNLLFWAALAHGVQLPAMMIASRALRWDAPGEHRALTVRIQRVLSLTAPAAALAWSVLVAMQGLPVLSTELGTGLLLLAAGQIALLLWRRAASAGERFARQRVEIVFAVLGSGLLVATNATETIESALGRQLCGVLFTLFLVRLVLQICYYRKLWPGGRVLRVGFWLLAVLFAVQSGVYGASALSGREHVVAGTRRTP